MRRGGVILERALYAGAALLLGAWIVVAAEGWWSQTTLGHRLAELHGETGGHGARRARREAGRSGLVGRITIPRLRISSIIVEGTTDARLRAGVGHVTESPFPGERGNVVLAAHRDTYFRALRNIARGDRVILTTPDGVFRYRVDYALVVTPDRTDLIANTPSSALTLVTCYPFHYIGPAPDRFIVRSSLVTAPPPVRGSARRHPGGRRRAGARAPRSLA